MGQVLSPNPVSKLAPLKSGANPKLAEIDRQAIYIRTPRPGFGKAVLTRRRGIPIRLDLGQLPAALNAAG
jgi:hypothetical protein